MTTVSGSAMTIAVGAQLSAYEIVAQVGAAGICEKCLAQDTTLDWQVAL